MKKKKKMSIRFKILIPAATVIVLFGLILGTTSYKSIYDGMLDMGIEEAQMAAKAAENAISGAELETIVPGKDETEGYNHVLINMRRIQESYGIKYLYTLYTDGKKVYYGVDADISDGHMDIGDEFEVSYSELKSVFMGEPYEENEIDFTDDGEALISVYRPIKNESGRIVAILGCDYDASDIVSRLNKTVLKLIIISLLCMIAALVFIGFIVQNIMNSLDMVGEKISELVDSDGDLGKQLEVHTGDELEDIANNVNTILCNIFEQANIAREVADGNLMVKVVPKSKNDLLGNALFQLVEQNLRVLLGIREAAKRARIGSSQMVDASEALAQGTAEQAAAIEQITASISSVSAQTVQNEKDADMAAKLITQSIGKVDIGNEHMSDMMTAMNDINRASEGISKINKTIDDIAFQTNILALNAEVEAARAGEAGKGFSIVAEEVRSLAAKSAAAAAEASALIEDSVKKTITGSQIANDVEEALDAITKVVTESVEIIHSIAESSSKQTVSIAQIDTAIEQVSKALQTNSSASQECAVTSAHLSEQMSAVDRMLDVYKM